MIRFLLTITLMQVVLLAAEPDSGSGVEKIRRLVNEGRWQQAQSAIMKNLSNTHLKVTAKSELLFEQERMRRIQLDFSRTREQIMGEIRKVIPSVSDALFNQWEQEGAIEHLSIDGQKMYFKRAAGNLFRLSAAAKAMRDSMGGKRQASSFYRVEDIRDVLDSYKKDGQSLAARKNFRVKYTLDVKANAVSNGEVIRAWLPMPLAQTRQGGAKLLHTDPASYVTSPAHGEISSVYLEKECEENKPTHFEVSYEFSSGGQYHAVDAGKVVDRTPDDPVLLKFTVEQPPHIVFSEDIRTLSARIVGQERNPYRKARLIFQWVFENIPWAGAREYSTLECLPDYALKNKHGDCGIQTMLFMTLCRFNGIPARWESGWVIGTEPNMHDWCRIYLAPYGWIPVDVSHGLVDSANEAERWFFLGGLDAYRLVVNTDLSQPLNPAKNHFRSEIVDFQRGEVEWRGGNIYFDQWDCDMQVNVIQP